MQLTDAGFLKKLRAIAKDSYCVVLTKHAKQRMKQRRHAEKDAVSWIDIYESGY